MKSFREKYPGLSEEQLRIKYKIWERERKLEEELLAEKEKQKDLYESIRRRNPFSRKDGDEDTGGWDEGFSADFGNPGSGHGVVSDAALSGSLITFIYPDGTTRNTITDKSGEFDAPQDFYEGDIIVTGGIDTVNGLPYKGEFAMDAEFFFKYGAITPLTHIANHIWLNTQTRTPDQAMEVVMNHLPDILGISIPYINVDKMFNNDHVKLTLEGVDGAKEVQAMNTIIEIHSDLIGHTEANNEEEIKGSKKKALESIGNALLIKINQQTNKNYVDSVFEFHDIQVENKYKDCCLDLIIKASSIVNECLNKNSEEATSNMQALNLAVKSEWSQKALEMTEIPSSTKSSIWKGIENKSTEGLLSSINLPQI